MLKRIVYVIISVFIAFSSCFLSVYASNIIGQATVYSYSEFWNSTDSYYQLASMNGTVISFNGDYQTSTVPIDWSGIFPNHELVQKNYMPSGGFSVEMSGVSPEISGSSYSLPTLSIRYNSEFLFKKGYTYVFFFTSYCTVSALNGSNASDFYFNFFAVRNDSQYMHSSFSYGSQNNFATVTIQPSEDTTSLFMFFSGNIEIPSSKPLVYINLTLSSAVEYPSNAVLPDVVPDSQLDSLVDAFYNNPYGELSPRPSDDIAPPVDESAALAGADAIIENFEGSVQYYKSGGTFWRSMINSIYEFSLFVPFILLSLVFLIMRSVLGR